MNGNGATSCPGTDMVHEVFVPGRLCVLGEHTDWAAGYRDRNRDIPPGFTLVATTQEGLHARVSGRRDGRLVFRACTPSHTVSGNHTAVAPLDIPMTMQALEDVIADGGFYMYAAGTVLVTCSKFGLLSPDPTSGASSMDISGLTVDNHLTTLPLKKGLSSSAAVCVLVVRALCLVYGLDLTVPEVMELAHLGEARAGSKCGRMDQCCALGTNHLAVMFFDGEDVQLYEVAPPENGIFLVVADLNGAKDTIKMLARLNECFPQPQNEDQERVHRYIRENPKLAWRAVKAVELGDAQELGRVMTEAQDNFDKGAIPIFPSEFSSPLLHAVISEPRLKELTWGIKGVGAQGDGSVQLLARGHEEQAEIIRVLSEMGMTFVLPITVKCSEEKDGPSRVVTVTPPGSFETVSIGGKKLSVPVPPPPLHPRRVRSAVVVAAGLSTRMFPASAVVKKELFPIVDHDGMCKPVILAILEGLTESGIDRFVIVVQEKDIAVFDEFFSMRAVLMHKHRLKPAQRSYIDRIQRIRSRITYVIQHEQEGFGHAVYCARNVFGFGTPEMGRGGVTVQSAVASQLNDGVSKGGDRADNKFPGSALVTGAETNGLQNGAHLGERAPVAVDGAALVDSRETEAFLLVLGDHLYRRGAGTTRACASQLIHAYLENGEAGKPAIGLKVMEESSVSPYGVAAGECVSHPSTQVVERWQKAATRSGASTSTSTTVMLKEGCQTSTACVSPSPASASSLASGADPKPTPLGGRAYRLTRLVEKPTAEFARENLITPGLGPSKNGEGRHLVVFGQYILPAKRTFEILGENIRLGRRERGEFQLTSVLEQMRYEDDGTLGCVIHGDALDMGIPGPYVATMGSFAMPHLV